MLGWCSQLPGKRERAGPETQGQRNACLLPRTYSVAKSLGQHCFLPDPKPEHVFKTTLIPLHAVYKWPVFWPMSAYKSGYLGKGTY